jgi:hypothetical protein
MVTLTETIEQDTTWLLAILFADRVSADTPLLSRFHLYVLTCKNNIAFVGLLIHHSRITTRMEHGMHSKTNSDDGVPKKKYIS